jgi:hypothetical protein
VSSPRLFTAATAAILALSLSPAADADRAPALLEFHSMYGVDGPFLGDGFPIRGIPGDTLPWTIEAAEGRLDADGRLTLDIRGLVLTDDPAVPAEVQGINDEKELRVAVSCFPVGPATRAGISSRFPATVTGDARVETKLELPRSCAEPVVLILAGHEASWLAVAGFVDEDDGE